MDVSPIAESLAVSLSPTSWFAGLLQSADSFYPTGSYAHSYGLEGLVSQGTIHDRSTLRQFLLMSVLPSLERSELPLVAHAWTAFGTEDWQTIETLSVLSSALKTARETRSASENIGRQRAELVATLYPNSVAAKYTECVATRSWPYAAPISAALEARIYGAPIEAALVAHAYSTVTSTVAAAMKLLRIGQVGGQTLITELMQGLPAIVEKAQTIPQSEIGWFNPWLDIASARHETADARMFIS